MLLSALTLVVAAAQPPPQPQLSVAVMEMTGADVPAERKSFLTEHLALKLAEAGARVSSPKQLTSMLGIERQKQLLGCSEDSNSCMAELAEALGSDVLLIGNMERVNQTLHLSLKLTSSSGRIVATWSGVGVDDSELKAGLEDAAEQVAKEAAAALGRSLAPLPKASKGVRRFSWAPAAVAVGATIAGVALFVLARNTYQKIPQSPAGGSISELEARGLVATGTLQQSVGIAMVAVAGAALVGAAAMFIFGAPQPLPVTPAVSVEPGKASLLLGGTFW